VGPRRTRRGRRCHALEHVDGIERIDRVRLRWVGHRLEGDATITLTTGDATTITTAAEQSVRAHVKNLDEFLIAVHQGSHKHPAS
jgi:divalent metal cation (Fe/Co/Zn/Cd) transporter